MDLSRVEPVSHQGNTNEWFTPKWILNKCGEFDLDPCGDTRWPTANACYSKNGLEQEWFGRVWLNPPYGRHVGNWLYKMKMHNNGMALVFARTDTKWFQHVAPYCSWILFIKGRVKFVNSKTLKESERNPGAPSMLMAFGNQKIPEIEGVYLYNRAQDQ